MISNTPPTVASNATPGTAQPATPSARAQPFGLADFLLLLGQITGAPQATAAAVQGVAGGLQEEGLEPESLDLQEAVAELALAVPLQAIEPLKGMRSERPAGLAGVTVEAQASIFAQPALTTQAPVEMLISETAATTAALGAEPTSSVGQATAESASPRATAAATESSWARPLHTPVGAPAWSEEVGARITMMVEQGRQSASLRLSPEHLGPLEIRLSVADGEAKVWFGAAHADTRAAIEHALPRLRELFAAQGLSLTDAGVFREPPREQRSAPSPSLSNSASETEPTASVSAVAIKLGLVDAYA